MISVPVEADSMDHAEVDMHPLRFCRSLVMAAVLLAALGCPATLSAEATSQQGIEPAPVILSSEHLAAVNRPRRIVSNNDIGSPQHFGMDIKSWVEINFSLYDEPGSQVDSVVWCLDEGNIAAYPSKVIPMVDYPGLKTWLDARIDPVTVLVDETHRRKLEVFWAYRLNGRDVNAKRKSVFPPFKAKHPEWMLDKYHLNLAIPEVRKHKLKILRELAENYDFDGIDIDFSRTPPSLPVGRQWLHRDCMTDFMRRLRAVFQEVAHRRGRPLLLSARLPGSIAGCHYDGLNIETWAKESLLDIIFVGSRSIELDLEGYRRVAKGRNIKLVPSLDEYHTTDGYRHPPIAYLRGFYANWWHQGADAAGTFNWHNVTPAVAKKYGLTHPAPPCQVLGNREIGSPKTLLFKDKVFVVQRRYGELGKTWNIYQNINAVAPLPVVLPSDGTPAILSLYVGDDVARHHERVARVELRVLLAAAAQAKAIQIKLNGVLLAASPAKGDHWRAFQLTPHHVALGTNLVSLRPDTKGPKVQAHVTVEKVEVHVDYKD